MPRSTIVFPDETFVDFIKLTGQPQRAGSVLMLFDRPGKDGTDLLDLGKRGVPFKLWGFRDFDDMETAVTELEELRDKAQGKQVIIYDGSGAAHTQMVCLSVEPREPKPALGMVGGFSEQGGAVAEVEMTFIQRRPAT